MSDTLTIARPDFETADSAKRRQIIEGARAVFLAQGFDAASMNDIARKAGVSKGTLYVYFDSKEALFVAITDEQCHKQADSVFVLAGTFKPVLFNFAPPPPPERIAHVVDIAVRVFMKAHGKG